MKRQFKHTDMIGGYFADAEFFKMSHSEFLNWSGGRLSVALFKGEFTYELDTIINMATARGIRYEMEFEKK